MLYDHAGRDTQQPRLRREDVDLLRHNISCFLDLQHAVLEAPREAAAFASLAKDIPSHANKAEPVRDIHKLRIVGVGDSYAHLPSHIVEDGFPIHSAIVGYRDVGVADLNEVVHHFNLRLAVSPIGGGAYEADNAGEDEGEPVAIPRLQRQSAIFLVEGCQL